MKRKKMAFVIVTGILLVLFAGCAGTSAKSALERQESIDVSAAIIDTVEYTPVDATYPVVDTSAMTLLEDRIWYLGKDI